MRHLVSTFLYAKSMSRAFAGGAMGVSTNIEAGKSKKERKKKKRPMSLMEGSSSPKSRIRIQKTSEDKASTSPVPFKSEKTLPLFRTLVDHGPKSESSLPIEKRGLIILDLNGTLLCRTTNRDVKVFMAEEKDITINSNPFQADFGFKSKKVYHRPFLADFLRCLSDLRTKTDIPYPVDIAVWTSARYENVIGILDHLIQTNMPPSEDSESAVATAEGFFDFIWTQKHCDPSEDLSSKEHFRKDLGRTWSQAFHYYDPTRKVTTGLTEVLASNVAIHYSPKRTVLIDDSPEKYAAYPYNGIAVPSYSLESLHASWKSGPTCVDKTLIELSNYMGELVMHKNWQKQCENSPFLT